MAEILVYGASWCPDCRRAKRFLADQRVAYAWHDIESEPEGAKVVRDRNDGKNIIPTVIFPDGTHLSEPSNEELAEKLGLQRQAMQHVYDLIIVGGGPAGLTTAIYAARENLETLIIDSKGLGGQAGVTERLDNYPGFPEGIGGAELADRFVKQAERYGVEMLQAVSVTTMSADSGTTADGDELDVETATGDHYHARAALVATGSSYRRTNADGEDDLIGAGVHFCATCDGPFYKGSEELMVVGGGNSGLEEGVFLTQFTDKVTIVEQGDRLRGSRILQDKVLDQPEDGGGAAARGEGVPEEGRRLRQARGRADRGSRDGTDRGTSSRRRVRLHRPRSEHHVPPGDRRPRRAGVRRDRPHLDELDAGGLRRRRRPERVDQAARVRGGRGRGGGDPDPWLSRPARATPHGVGEDVVMSGDDHVPMDAPMDAPMEAKEIFELLVKADEKLKYATAEKSDARRRQARDLLTQALDAARQIGNDALVQQAELRLSDLA